MTMAGNLAADLETIRTLRSDLALQLARHFPRVASSQAGVARALRIPQPTLSKIIHGQVDNLSLELMLRIATRARLHVVLLTGKDPAEAGVFVTAPASRGRAQRSSLADRARNEVSVRQRLTPEQRLDAQLQQSQLLAELRGNTAIAIRKP